MTVYVYHRGSGTYIALDECEIVSFDREPDTELAWDDQEGATAIMVGEAVN